MRFKPTLILLFLAAVGLGYYFLVEQPGHKDKIDKEEREKKLTPLTPEEIFGLVVRRNDATLTFTRSGDSWQMTDPVNDHADMRAIMVLVLSVLRSTIDQQFPADPERLAEYGLTEPIATVQIRDSLQADLLTLDIGDFNLTKSHCYVRDHRSDNVVLFHAGVRRYALIRVFEFREKKVIDFPIEEVTAVEIDSDLNRTSWNRSAVGGWFTVQDRDTIRGDSDAIDTILRELLALRARDILDGVPAGGALSDPAGSIALRFMGSLRIGLSFSGPDSQRCYIRTEGKERVNVVDASALDVFGRSLHDLRDRRVLHFDRDLLGKVTLDTETLSISILKTGAEWSFANPSLGNISRAEVSTFFGSLENMKYREIVEETIRAPEDHGLEPPVYRLALFDAQGHLVDEVVTGPTRTAQRIRYVTSLSSRHLGIADAELFDEIEGLFKEFQLQ
jgi:hypothetical protein